MEFFAAPMQGHTEGAFCRFHSEIYGAADCYCTPFIRVERGEVRRRDLRVNNPAQLAGIRVVPQAIFRDTDELRLIAAGVRELGFDALDLNLGCPFPPQVKHGRGAALLRNPALLESLAGLMQEFPSLKFSIKMRLGVEHPDEWRKIAGIINALPLARVTVHPRVATQQYGGELYMEQFDAITKELQHPLVYNGDLTTPHAIESIMHRYPALKGVMAGRGLLARPSLHAEWRQQREWTPSERIDKMLEFHRRLFNLYRDTLCGDSQILMKIKPFWEYLEPEIGHKPFKAIRKASTIAKYTAAIESIRND